MKLKKLYYNETHKKWKINLTNSLTGLRLRSSRFESGCEASERRRSDFRNPGISLGFCTSAIPFWSYHAHL